MLSHRSKYRALAKQQADDLLTDEFKVLDP
jgi:hypothetical protein